MNYQKRYLYSFNVQLNKYVIEELEIDLDSFTERNGLYGTIIDFKFRGNVLGNYYGLQTMGIPTDRFHQMIFKSKKEIEIKNILE